MTIDWKKPIEAYHEDGRVVPVEMHSGPYGDGDYRVTPPLDGYIIFFPESGNYDRWRIRNRTSEPAAPEPAPDTLTLRDQFAMAAPINVAMAADVSDLYGCNWSEGGNRASLFDAWAKLRYEFADAMILERNRERDA